MVPKSLEFFLQVLQAASATNLHPDYQRSSKVPSLAAATTLTLPTALSWPKPSVITSTRREIRSGFVRRAVVKTTDRRWSDATCATTGTIGPASVSPRNRLRTRTGTVPGVWSKIRRKIRIEKLRRRNEVGRRNDRFDVCLSKCRQCIKWK